MDAKTATVFRCEVCDKELSDGPELQTHLEGHAEKIAEGESPLPPRPKCAFCEATFDTPEELRDHHATAHRK
ncbi:MAG: hypothetical protein L3K19_03390 [Thermoplasmata archaeon]|nr:hypothetical protein [Thermoplasmata archaeon]